MPSAGLTPELSSDFATIALSHVTREYPHRLDHTMAGPDDVCEPHVLHPLFHGSFDWHSCVNSHWVLARLLRRFPEMPEAKAIGGLFDAQFTPSNVEAELAYLRRPESRGFERTYGWAWFLMLAAELRKYEGSVGSSQDERAGSVAETGLRAGALRWSQALSPLADAFVERFTEFLPKATYPIRTGTHPNSAFSIILALEYATGRDDEARATNSKAHEATTDGDDFAAMLRAKAGTYFSNDADCQAWEPNGNDFLSSALTEAHCMQRSLRPAEFNAWFERFLPRFREREPKTLFEPAIVSDRSDGQIAHLDGYNLSRAWSLRALSESFDEGDPRLNVALESAEALLQASLPHLDDDYMGSHWLATYATLAADLGCRG